MEASTQLLFEQLGIALLLGILMGLQRQRTESPIAGLRTFPLIAFLGVLALAAEEMGFGFGYRVGVEIQCGCGSNGHGTASVTCS